MKNLIFALIILIPCALQSRASLIVTLDSPDQIGAPGDTLNFSATLFNDSNDIVFLNSDSLTSDDGPFQLFDPFLIPVSIDPNSSVYVELFEVLINPDAPGSISPWAGNYQILGGLDEGSQLSISSNDFSVTVTPEPAAWTLFVAGMAAVFCLRRQRRSAQ